MPGVQTKLGVGDANPITNSTTTGRLLDITGESLQKVSSWIDGNGLKGDRSHYAARTREGSTSVGGSVDFNPVTADLAYLMQKVMGGASLTAPTLAATVPSFVVQKQLITSGSVYTYATMYANTLSLVAERDQPVRASMGLLGLTEVIAAASGTADTFPQLTFDTTTAMLVFHDAVMTFNTTAYPINSVSFGINNGLQERRINARAASAIVSTDRSITISGSMPWANTTALYSSLTDATVAIELTFSYLNQSVALTMPAVRITNATPTTSGREDRSFSFDGMAFATGASAELTCAIDSDPA